MAAPDAETNEDQWLYGDDDDNTAAETSEPTLVPTSDVILPKTEDVAALELESKADEASDEPPADNIEPEASEKDVAPSVEGEDESKKDGEDGETDGVPEKNVDEDGLETIEDFDDEDSDDDVNIVIGDIKTGPTAYTNFNVKRGAAPVATGDKSKFTPDEFEGVGMINGVPAHEFNIDSLEDKPWRKPGADITDYFNYGFNEATWQAYCERQKRMRTQESGTGLTPAMGPIAKALANSGSATGGAIVNENSKYSGVGVVKKAGPPPARKLAGSIDVIGGNVPVRRDRDRDRGDRGDRERDRDAPAATSESAIQVMTAEKREYSRKTTLPDVSVPPPGIPPFDIPTIPTVVGTPLIVPTIAPFMDPYGSEYFAEQESTYYSGFEPTQDSQWGTQPGWPGANLSVPPPILPGMGPPPRGHGDGDERDDRLREKSSRRDEEERDKDRDREKDDREKERDRDRERDSRRDRDRDREKSSRDDKDRRRRHRSGSRSPSSSSSHKRKRSKRSRESSERD